MAWDDYEIDGNVVNVVCNGEIIDTIDLDALITDYLDEYYGEG